MLNWDKIFIPYTLAIGYSQRKAHDRAIERTPNIDNAITTLEKLFRVLRSVEFYSLGCGHGCLINMYALNRISVASRSANCVVKDDYSLCVKNVVQQKLLDLRIVYAAYSCIVLKLCLCTLDVLVCVERIVLEIKLLFLASQIIQPDSLPVITPIALRDIWKWFDIIVWW